MGELLGEQNHPRLAFGGTHSPDVPPFCFGCQWFLLSVLVEIKVGLSMKKAPKYRYLEAFKLAPGGAVFN